MERTTETAPKSPAAGCKRGEHPQARFVLLMLQPSDFRCCAGAHPRASQDVLRLRLACTCSSRRHWHTVQAHVSAAVALFHASTLDAVRSGMAQASNLSEDQARGTSPPGPLG